MVKLIRTTSDHPDFKALVNHLDTYLAEVDGDDHAFYDQFNSIDNLKYVVIAFEDDQTLGCGAIKPYDLQTMEVKRMYTSPEARGKGIASKILHELEQWAKELGYQKCILETGKRQYEAVSLYKKNGYTVIPNYGQYAEMENSVCFNKNLR